jgi:hypothetical protein
VKLEFKWKGDQRQLGCFRLSAAPDANAIKVAAASSAVGFFAGSRRRPILDLQSRHSAQIAILGDNSAIAQGEGDRGCLHIDDGHDAAGAPEFVAETSKMSSRFVFERPFGDSGEPPNETVAIEFLGRTALDTKPQLTNYRPAGANAITARSRFVNALGYSSAAIDEVPHDSGVQKKAPHSKIPSIRRSRSPAFAMSNSFCIFRSALQAASSSGVITRGSKL